MFLFFKKITHIKDRRGFVLEMPNFSVFLLLQSDYGSLMSPENYSESEYIFMEGVKIVKKDQ